MPNASPDAVDLTVVIATRNRPAMLNESLQRLLAEPNRPAEVVIVDSASDTDEAKGVATRHGARYVRLDVPGVCHARNAGWRVAQCDAIAFLDDDIRIHPDWAPAMARALGSPEIDFVTGWIGVPPGQEDAQDPQPLMVEPSPRRLDAATREHMGASANMGATRRALELVGGFDERLGPGTWFAASEDEDLFDRLVRSGCVGRYCPDVRVDHEAWRTKRQRLRQHWCYGKGTGARLRILWSTDRRRALREARERLWRRGVVQMFVRIGQRWLIGATCSFLRVTGAAVSFAVAAATLREPWAGE